MFIELYNSTAWADAQVIITPIDNSNKKYGEGVHKFGEGVTLPILLPRRGWEFVKRTRGYVYLRPPKENPTAPFLLNIKIPTKEQALEIANSCYKEGESWRGQIGEWPAIYLHKHEQTWTKHWTENGQPKVEILKDQPKSSLYIGDSGVWQATLQKKEGEDFSFYEIGSYLGKPETKGINSINPAYLEGKVYSIEQTKYERDPEARRECLNHYGCKCQICGFDFEKTYGTIGEGFIHVHHIEPISTRGGEYEVDPIKDLIPVCPNCHAMIHRRKVPFKIEEIKAILNLP